MCWNLPVSIIFAAIGFISTGYLVHKKSDKLLWIPTLYFSLMELLQAITYLYINNCSLPSNQLLTFLSYLHICFQPIAINMLAIYFIPKYVRKKISFFVYTICFIGTILLLIKLYPFDWAGSCIQGTENLCGSKLCSMYGQIHLAWYLPLNGINYLDFGYFLPVLILPLIYGSWRALLYGFVFGPFLAYLITSNPNEFPSIWCLLSIAIIALALFTKIRKLLHVKKWYSLGYSVFFRQKK